MVEIVNDVSVRLIQSNASDNMVAMAAWVSHDMDSEERLGDPGRVQGVIDFLWRNNHTSPFEHGNITVKVDAPLFVAREWHRHRTQSYNEVSGRYTIMKPRFYAGRVARIQHGKAGDYYFEDGTDDQTALYLKSKERAVEFAWKEYEYRLALGMAKEQAREDLPLSLMTQWYATANPLNWMKFLTLRNESHALREIQDAARQVEAILADAMPMAYMAYARGREEDRNPQVIVNVENHDTASEQLKDIMRGINTQAAWRHR